MKDTKQLIINALENKGLKHRKDFTISRKWGGYSEIFNVTLKNIKYSIKEIERIVATLESYDRDEYTGEILSGGNTFIDVKYAYAKNSEDHLNILQSYAKDNYIDEAIKLLNIDNEILLTNSCILLKKINNINIYYIKVDHITQLRIIKDGDYSAISTLNYPDAMSLAIALARANLGHYSRVNA